MENTSGDEVLKAVTKVSMLQRYQEECRMQAAAAGGTASSNEKDKKTTNTRLFPAPDAASVSFSNVPPAAVYEDDDDEQPPPTYNVRSTDCSSDVIKKTVVPRLAMATFPPDAPLMQVGEVEEEEVALPSANEEQAADVPSMNVDSTGIQEQAYPAFLAPDPEEARRRVLEQAVSATNVHVVETRKKRKSDDKWMTALLIAALVSVAAIALSIGFTLGRREDFIPSMLPNPVPMSERFGQVVTLVESLSGKALQDPSSPQYQAAQWMADVDVMFEDLSIVDIERFHQRYIMALFYFATGGPTSWIETSFFLKPDIHECEWRDKGLPDTQSWSGFVGVFNCSADDWVEGIEINQNNLTGTLPNELGSLSSLTELTVFQNFIGGTLPSSIFSLSNMQILTLSINEFTGTIPTEVGLATPLLILSIFANSFSGTIPSEIKNLSSLYELYFNDNFLTGTIPTTLLQLHDITFIDFAMNSLTGTLPPSLWLNWPKLTGFGVLDNQVTGTIPNNLDSVPYLKQLVLSGNNFTGPFPSSIVKLANVASFNVGFNDLTGSLPNDWSNLSSTLEWLQVHDNSLVGTLPVSLGSLTKLEVLNLFENEFNGTLPALGNLTKLLTLQVGETRLTGTVPMNLAPISSLRWLDFHRTQLTGDLSYLCNGTEMLFPYMHRFYADCLGEFPEVVCPCCNRCCAPNNTCLDM